MTLFSETDFIWGAWRARQNADSATPAGFARRLELARSLGISWIDHADIYDDGAVESLHGEASQHLTPETRSGLRLITKCGIRFPSPNQADARLYHYRSDAAFIRSQAETSLKRLKADRIDLYLLHRPDYLMQSDETAAALEELVRSGKIASYGVSNFSATQFDRLQTSAARPLAAHQIELSPLASHALDNGVLDQALARKMPLLIWSPLAGGQLFSQDERAVHLRDKLQAAAERSDCTDIAAAALAWLKCLPGTIIPILGTMSEDRMRIQVEEARRIHLDAQDWYEILEAGRGERLP